MEMGVKGTGVIAASAAVSTMPVNVYGVVVVGTATAGSVKLLDGGVSGTELFHAETPNTAGWSYFCSIPNGLKFATSCYCTLANAKATILYK